MPGATGEGQGGLTSYGGARYWLIKAPPRGLGGSSDRKCPATRTRAVRGGRRPLAYAVCSESLARLEPTEVRGSRVRQRRD